MTRYVFRVAESDSIFQGRLSLQDLRSTFPFMALSVVLFVIFRLAGGISISTGGEIERGS